MFDTIRESLAIDLRVLLLNGAAFLVLLFVMDRLFWKPVMQHLKKREENIQAAYNKVDATREEMETLRNEYQTRLDGIEAEARARIQATLKDAQKARDDVLADARAVAERILREGAEQIEADRLAALEAAESRLEQAALEALGKAQGEPPDDEQRRRVREYIRSRVQRN